MQSKEQERPITKKKGKDNKKKVEKKGMQYSQTSKKKSAEINQVEER